MADPWVVGNFYEGSEFIRRGDLSPGNYLESVALLVDIEAKPEHSAFFLRQYNWETGDTLLTLKYYRIQSGSINIANDNVGVNGSVPKILSSWPPPHYLVFTDENNVFRYVYPDVGSGGALVATGSFLPQFLTEQEWFIGSHLDMADVTLNNRIYRITVNSSNVISITLHEDNSLRNNEIHISGGHRKPYQQSTDTLWLNQLQDFEGYSAELRRLDIGFGGLAIAQSGGIVIDNTNRKFSFLANQSIVDRDISVRLGYESQDISTYKVISRNTALSASIDLDMIDVTFQDKSIYFDQFIQENTFLGTGLEEGDADVQGRVKPLAWGYIKHATPMLINSGRRVYFLHDGIIPISFVPSVYEGAIPRPNLGHFSDLDAFLLWTPTSEQVTSGGFIWHNGAPSVGVGKGAMFRLANNPVGRITCSFLGGSDAGLGYGNQIIQTIVGRIKKASITINTNSFAKFNTDYPYRMSLYIDQPMRIRDAINQILEPIGAYGFLNNINELSIGKVGRTAPKAIITQREWQDTGGSLSKEAGPGGYKIYRIGAEKKWSLFTDGDFLGLAEENEALKLSLKNEYIYSVRNNYDSVDSVSSRNETLNTIELNTLLLFQDDSQILIRDLQHRNASFTEVIRVIVRGFAYQFNLVDTVLFDPIEWDTSFPRLYIIVGIRENSPLGARNLDEIETELTLWG